MSKLSAILISASLTISALAAAEQPAKPDEAANVKVIEFLQKTIGRNPNIVKLDAKVTNIIPVDEPKGWNAYVVMLDATVNANGQQRQVQQQKIYFVNGDVITPELHNMRLKRRINDLVSPPFDTAYYSDHNLIYGNKNAAHKVAIFSDPLCPFCRNFVPTAIEEMKASPETFAIYYYHLPLAAIHPAAVTLTKAAIAAELQGRKDVVLEMYKVNVDPKESDPQKILDAFNKALGTSISLAQINDKSVADHYQADHDVAMAMMVNGTPTLFFDGEKDASKTKYRAYKGKK